MAEMIGVTLFNFERQLTRMRSQGYEIPKKSSSLPLGTVHGVMKKTKDGWKYIRKTTDPPTVHRKDRDRVEKWLPDHRVKHNLQTTAGGVIEYKTRILLPGGGYIECDTDKVKATLRHLQKLG